MRRLTLSEQLFYRVVLIFLAFAGSFLLYQSGRERSFKRSLLNQRLQDYNIRLGEELRTIPVEEERIDEYIQSHSIPSLRVTILDVRGYVLFDNRTKDYPNLSDHRHRKEIKEALESGTGFDVDRFSDTVEEEFFYSATLIPDTDIIIRSALPYDDEMPSVLKSDTTFLWFAAMLMVSLILVLLWFSKRTGDSVRRRQETARSVFQKELTQNISHELKTPVAEIRAYLETIHSNPDMPEETRIRFVERGWALSKRLSSLVEDLCSLNDMDCMAPGPEFIELDVAQVIRSIAIETENAFAEAGLSLSLDIPQSIRMRGAKERVYSIFRNLVDNSLNYAGSGATVWIRATRDGDFWRFIFSDDGQGVPEESIPLLFDRFYRVDKGRSREMGGTGLGLAIVKDAVELHGGTIRVSANSPSGLKYEFCLNAG